MKPLGRFERVGLWCLIAIIAHALRRDFLVGDWMGVGVALFAIVLFGSLLWTPRERGDP